MRLITDTDSDLDIVPVDLMTNKPIPKDNSLPSTTPSNTDSTKPTAHVVNTTTPTLPLQRSRIRCQTLLPDNTTAITATRWSAVEQSFSGTADDSIPSPEVLLTLQDRPGSPEH